MSSTDAVKRAMCAKPREGTWPSVSSPHLKKTSVSCHIRGEIYSRAFRSSVARLSWLRLKVHLGSSALVFTERRGRQWKEAAPHDLEGWTGTALNPVAAIGKLATADVGPAASLCRWWQPASSHSPGWKAAVLGLTPALADPYDGLIHLKIPSLSVLGAQPEFRSWSGKGVCLSSGGEIPN
ncbi:hypothetical protein MUK42_37260 [Musa troglodytarum]|uniref:Uncharacterized protein n=1 Tax=Musa troglodytarum TaxID=320322 RepID=A0A9E7HUS6_9LILI|nr:hypothetical protein MUK42_37260 [Musa troglodytarum]